MSPPQLEDPATALDHSIPPPRRSKRLRDDLLQKQASQREEETGDKTPLVTAGLLADIQYAPVPDGYSYSGTPRYYQNSLQVARLAAAHFERDQMDLLLNLGDIVDGKCQSIETHGGTIPNGDKDNAESIGAQCVNHVLEALQEYQNGVVLHSYGNHCLYNLDRPNLQQKLGIPFVQESCGDWVGYYSHLVKTKHDDDVNVRFIVLDSYDICLLRQVTSQKRQRAVQLLKEKNGDNFAKGLENSPEGLQGLAKRYVAFNGGVDERQLTWMQETLEQARQNQEMCIILSHQPIMPGSTNPICLVWNYTKVLELLRSYRDVVAASFSGHKGGYRRDEKSGIHFRVVEAVLENPHPHATYATLAVHRHKLELTGFGNCESATYELDHLELSPQKKPQEAKDVHNATVAGSSKTV
eukprot:CAMPEP_0172470150 /NCGR_PEP_ID=MMETSP1065-20121228/65585_1 /TAXON_ID=265537 /ORGANISM="Amphiprora paludosa, Strain CCMP125" /LENGTH=410 /DNA_ID=CAMNT_0013228001 /DNA_START=222 /DNA_END=1454 /DNA_ORIENTATION=-